MSALNIIAYATAGSLVNVFYIVAWHKLSKEKINWKSIKPYIILLIMTVIGTIINFTLPQYLKILSLSIFYVIITYFCIVKNIKQSIIVVFISQLIIMISEFALVEIITLVFNQNMDKYYMTTKGIILTNIIVTLFAFVLLKTKIFNKLFNYLIDTFKNIKRGKLILYFIFTIVLIICFLIMAHFNMPLPYLLMINTILTLLYIVMIFRVANATERERIANNKYATSLTTLRENEQLLKKYKKDSHENDNQLQIIRNMLKSKDKKTVDYIDALLDNKPKDNEDIYSKVAKIPEGGLKAIIYSKLCKMEELNIDYAINIADDVNTGDLMEISDFTMTNICKIMGVFLDNAIEEVEKLKKKKIIIEIFIMDNNLIIDTSNNYKENIEIHKFFTKNYTTKGEGHGYGLSIVKDIIREDQKLDRETELNKDMFIQRLIIKM